MSALQRTHRRSMSLPLILSIACTLVTLLLALLPGVQAAPTAYPLPGQTTNYRQVPIENAPAFPQLAQVISPTAGALGQIGRVAFVNAPYAGPMFINRSCTAADTKCTRTFRISLLHKDDDAYLGCNNTHYTSSGREPFDENTMVLVQRRTPGVGCSFGYQALNATAIGAGAIMYHGCNPAAPTLCASDLTVTFTNMDIKIPTPYMQFQDANRWRTYLLLRDNYLASIPIPSSTAAAGPRSSTGSSSPSSTGEFVGDLSSSSSGSAGRRLLQAPSPYAQPLLVTFPATGPLDPSDKAALQGIAQNLMTQSGPAGVSDAPWPEWSALRRWSTLVTEPEKDPCLDRIIGLTCVDGRVSEIYLSGTGGPTLNGRFNDPLWGAFPRLRGLLLNAQNLQGPAPAELCNLNSLQVLSIDSQSDGVRTDVRQGVTELPDCLGRLPLIFLSASNNLIPSIPSTLSAIPTLGLRYLAMDNNKLTALPANYSTNLFGLAYFVLSQNPTLISPAPSFKNWPRLLRVEIDHCGFFGPMAPDSLDNLISALSIDVSFNFLNGSLPNIVPPALTTQLLASVRFNDNQFEGGIPAGWRSLVAVTSVRLQHNMLSGPMEALGGMGLVSSLDLSYNQITVPEGGNVGTLVASVSNNNINNLALDHNMLVGGWTGGLLGSQRYFRTLSMSYNGLNQLPPDMWAMYIIDWDLSFNNISGVFPKGIPGEVVAVNLEGNPYLKVWPLPSWLVESGESTTSSGSLFTCSVLINPAFRTLRFDIDAESRDFHGCTCTKGTFGNPPLCDAVPQRAEINPLSGASSSEVGSNFDKMIASMGSTSSSSSNGNASDATLLSLPAGFTDDWYGSTQRLTNGVSTAWFVNIQNLFYDTQNSGGLGPSGPSGGSGTGNSSAMLGGSIGPLANDAIQISSFLPGIVQVTDSMGNISSVRSTEVGVLARFQPVRIIRLVIHISRAEFNQPSDSISVYEGDASLSGRRVAAILGTDSFEDPPPYPAPAGTPVGSLHLTQTDAYRLRYGDALSRLTNRTQIEVAVLTNAASVHFNSRATEGSHFFATYTYEFACTPQGTYFLDPVTNQCRTQLPTYEVSPNVRYACFAMAALGLVWIAVNVAAIFWQWQAPLYRAASRPMMLLMLALLATMSVGAILYASVPKVTISSVDGVTTKDDAMARALCVSRVWLSALPLAGVLGVILAKTNRVDSIFGSMKTLKAHRVSDSAIMRSVALLLLLECGFLLAFTILPLSRPELIPGAGSLNTFLVAGCSLESGAMAWVGAQVAFFAILMVGAAVLAFRTRNLPSAFNESTHIQHCLTVLIFCAVLIVPLTLYVHDQPEATILLQGLGQALLSLLMTTILFAPKLYIIFTASTEQQKGMMSDFRAPSQMPGDSQMSRMRGGSTKNLHDEPGSRVPMGSMAAARGPALSTAAAPRSGGTISSGPAPRSGGTVSGPAAPRSGGTISAANAGPRPAPISPASRPSNATLPPLPGRQASYANLPALPPVRSSNATLPALPRAGAGKSPTLGAAAPRPSAATGGPRPAPLSGARLSPSSAPASAPAASSSSASAASPRQTSPSVELADVRMLEVVHGSSSTPPPDVSETAEEDEQEEGGAGRTNDNELREPSGMRQPGQIDDEQPPPPAAAQHSSPSPLWLPATKPEPPPLDELDDDSDEDDNEQAPPPPARR